MLAGSAPALAVNAVRKLIQQAALIKEISMDFHQVTSVEFHRAVSKAVKNKDPKFDKNISVFKQPEYATMRCVLHRNKEAGFAVAKDNEIVSVFNVSSVRGLGSEMIKLAIKMGGSHLNCFDGFLVEFYAKFGFKGYKREANWDGPGHPAVVFMRL